MKAHFSLILLLLVASPMVGTVAAAENNSTTPMPTANNSTSTPTATPISEGAEFDSTIDLRPNRTTYWGSIDALTKVVDWDYDGDKFVILVESKAPNRITLTEAVQLQEGMGTYQTKDVNVPKGRTKITFSAEPHDGAAAVFFATSQCKQASSCSYLSTGERTSDGSSPFEGTTSTVGWLGGAGVAVSMFGFAAYRRKNRDYGDVQEVR